MKTTFLKGLIAASAALAMVAGFDLAAPNQAMAGDKHVAGALIGGLIVGSIIGAHARPRYRQHDYYVRDYRPVRRIIRHRCHWERQRTFNENDGYYYWNDVKVCY